MHLWCMESFSFENRYAKSFLDSFIDSFLGPDRGDRRRFLPTYSIYYFDAKIP